VQVYGTQKYALRVRLNRAARQPRHHARRSAVRLSAHNVNLPTGLLDGNRQSLQFSRAGKLANVDEFRKVWWHTATAPVRLAELAEVIDSVQDTRIASWFGNREGDQLVPNRAILLAVQKQPGVTRRSGQAHPRADRCFSGSCRSR